MTLKVGDTIYLFDPHRRVYRKDGCVSDGPIWREHWVPREIVAETRVSWILSTRQRVPKKGAHGVAFTVEEVDRAAWVERNRYRIVFQIEHGNTRHNYDALRKIADVIGYVERPET